MQLIERYVHDVTRRLPERERGEVKLELEASIADMLPDNPSEEDIKETLNKLGAPYKLAEQYRQKPMYLISPAIYDLYITTLKSMVPIVAIVLACVGAFLGVGSLPVSASVGDIIQAVISEAIGFAAEGTLMGLFWVTLGFIIADRTGYVRKEWTVADLPDIPDDSGVYISRVSVIVSAALTVIFTAAFVMLVDRGFFFGGVMKINNTEIVSLVSQAALERLIPFIIVSSVASLVLAAVKFLYGRWSVAVCAVNAVYNLICAGIAIYIFTWPDLINSNFFNFAGRLVGVTSVIKFAEDGVTIAAMPVIIVIIIVITIINIGAGVRNTMKSLPR